jgi:hypothetical protein
LPIHVSAARPRLAVRLVREAREIATDDRGTGRADLFRSVAALPTGSQFDIHFQVIDAMTSAPVLQSGCYRYTVRGR